ncbi:HrcQ protein [Methylorubrum populi]|uniref:HrcQ protein n=1 Tax=Methylorubrum populi TaxID=223967 RepID=A0A160PD45_9HYPH|nr:type III secretion system cytoplasmic ring protein SctQ [Methylorubrum populi]BAU89953.1 HrcQ protein [Methylorubrum populi]
MSLFSRSVAPPCLDAPAVLRHRPRARLPEAAAGFVNRLARPRMPFEGRVEGLPLSLAAGAVLLDPAPPIPEAVELGLTVAGGRMSLRLPRAGLDRLARALQPDLAAFPEGPAGPLLVELVLAPLFAQAERITGAAITLVSIAPASTKPPGSLTLLVEGSLAGEPFPAQLDLGPAPLLSPAPLRQEALLALIEAAPARGASVSALPVAVAFVAGRTRLTLRQLASIEPGDAVLPDLWHPDRGETRAVLGEGLVAQARTDRHKSTLKTPFRQVAEHSAAASGDPEMAQDRAAQGEAVRGAAEAEASGLDAVSVALTFELGRRTLGLGELKSIGEGHVFDLGLDPEQPVDLVANGARIGQGEIVEIGERVGVRVVRLFGRD